MKTKIIITALVVFCALFLFVFVLPRFIPSFSRKEEVKWIEKFSKVSSGKPNVIEGWKFKGKPGTSPALFSIQKDKSNQTYLNMKADDASGSLITRINNIDVEKTPLLRWQWKVQTLPIGADGRYKKKDDQAIGIYVGTGSLLNNKSISYRWDTDTPKGDEGSCTYGGGAVKVKWITLRNKTDEKDKWFTEERNMAEDFKKAWGFYPKNIYISVSCNSQYTKTKADAGLNWIELASLSSGKTLTKEDKK